MKQNLATSLDRELIRRARVIAASRGSSVSTLVALELFRTVEEAEAYERAKRQPLAVRD